MADPFHGRPQKCNQFPRLIIYCNRNFLKIQSRLCDKYCWKVHKCQR